MQETLREQMEPGEDLAQRVIKVVAAEIDDLESRVLGIRSRPDEIPGMEGEL